MLFRSIAYNNFRPFKGIQKIDLKTKSDKSETNVVVLLGDNTFGKSTFVLSFVWCLYGISKFNKSESILNIKVENEMRPGSTETASVEIEFEDDNKIYTLVRKQSFYKDQNGDLKAEKSYATLSYQTPEGETKRVGKTQSDINLVIKSILPADLSDFFFFEGEKNNKRDPKNLKRDVETLIGLEHLREARLHVFGKNQDRPSPDSVLGEYLEKQKNESGNQAKEEYARYEEANRQLVKTAQEIEELNKNISYYEEKKEDIHALLERAAPSEEIRNNLRNTANNKKIYDKEITETSKEFIKFFGENSLPLLLYPFLEKVADGLKKLDVEDKGIRGLEASAIHALLKRGECLCGQDLKEGSAAYKKVKEYIDYVPPRSIGLIVQELLDNIESYSGKPEEFVQKYQTIYNKIVSYRDKYNECESIEKDLTDKLRSIGSIDTSEADRLPEYEATLTNLREQLTDATANKRLLEIESKKAFDKSKELSEKGNKSKKYREYYQYANEIYKWVEEVLAEQKKIIRQKLQSSLRDIFSRMYSGKREIDIDDKYNIRLTYQGQAVDYTGGLYVIMYFSYVAALVKVACEMMMERNPEENSAKLGEQYPLVLDAAFSHADVTHTQSIARELANSVPQLIFAVMHKDWEHAQTGLMGKVAHIYELEKIDETEVRIKQH